MKKYAIRTSNMKVVLQSVYDSVEDP